MKAECENRISNDNMSWAMIAGLVVTVIAFEVASPIRIALLSLAPLAVACAVLIAAAIFYTRVRINPRFRACCLCLAQALLFSAAGSILSYLLARDGGSLWDSTLQHWDRSLGFEWLAYVNAIDGMPQAAVALRVAYGSLIPQTIVVILALGFGGRLDRLRSFVLAAILSGSAAILLSPLFPAVGNFAYLGLKPTDFAHVWQSSNLADVRDFLAIRSGGIAALDLRTMQGIIVFPSYHGALATVSLWAFWTSGVRWLRWAGSAVALATIAATPAFGGHYFVDVIAGIALGLASIVAARRLAAVQVPLPAIRAWPSRRSHEVFAR